jgi:GxxExxY protein
MEIEEAASRVVDREVRVHLALEPGLLEPAYRACLAHELRSAGLEVEKHGIKRLGHRL